ncbi:MAG: hypothetical protein HGA44_01910 [Cellulomonadaceae bacterium]|nr:hypothetical protein [Cellulomonadaceae bacterium]
MTARTVSELVLADEAGVWAIRSTSLTTYYVDTDAKLLLRRVGPGSSPGLADGRWALLLGVHALAHGDAGVIRVGDRHKYTYDPDPNGPIEGWWLQRQVISITYVESEELASLLERPGGVS